jgi:hypothetical protein
MLCAYYYSRGNWNTTNQNKSFLRKKVESNPVSLKRRKPRRHREHRGTQSIVNQYYKLSELTEAISRNALSLSK